MKTFLEFLQADIITETGPDLLHPRQGEEVISNIDDSIKHYKGDEGRHRFVKHDAAGNPISALEIKRNRWDGKIKIANVYTDEAHRRKGHATELYKHAKEKFPKLAHSSDLTSSGAAWKKSLRKR